MINLLAAFVILMVAGVFSFWMFTKAAAGSVPQIYVLLGLGFVACAIILILYSIGDIMADRPKRFREFEEDKFED